jgi:hypothetical protein
MGKHRALVVACEFYTGDFSPIPNAVAEANAFGKALSTFGYEPFEVEYSRDEKAFEVSQQVGRFFTSAKPDDFVLFYFGGHGRKGDDGSLYLVLRDTKLGGIVYTSLQAAMLNQLIRDCPARKKVIVLDACYSAAIELGSRSDNKQIDIERYFQQGKGTAILTSANSVQLAYSRQDQRSFTYYLTDGLRSGRADMNGDGVISLDEWFDYAYQGVLSWQTGEKIQTPQMFIKSREGTIYIGKVTQEEPDDYPVTRLPHSSGPPLKCVFELTTRGDVPCLAMVLVNPNSTELASIEIFGFTGIGSRLLHTIKRISAGERVEYITPLYTDAGPILEIEIRSCDVYGRSYEPFGARIVSTSHRNPRQTAPGSGRAAKTLAGEQGEVSPSDPDDDEDESVLKKKPRKSFR